MLRKLLFTYYNNKIYNLNLLNKVVNFYLFKYNTIIYYLNFNKKFKKILFLLFYLKRKKCLV